MLNEQTIRRKYEGYLKNYIRTGGDTFLAQAEALGEILEISAAEEEKIYRELEAKVNK